MDEKAQFQELLSALVEQAAENENILDKETVKAQFAKLNLSEDMYQPIYDYLKEHKITVSGAESGDTADTPVEDSYNMPENFDISKEEAAFLEIYYKDLAALPKHSEDEIASAIAEKNSALLTEAYLPAVVTIAKSMTGRGVTLGDLIQEGNLTLMQALSAYTGEADAHSLERYVSTAVKKGMQNAIDVQAGAARIGKHLMEQANYLDEASRNLAKELNREPTLQELAEYTHLDEDEVHNIMKYSLDALNVEG